MPKLRLLIVQNRYGSDFNKAETKKELMER